MDISTQNGKIVIALYGQRNRSLQNYADAIVGFVQDIDVKGNYITKTDGDKLIVSRSEGAFNVANPETFLEIEQCSGDTIRIVCREGYISQSDLESLVR